MRWLHLLYTKLINRLLSHQFECPMASKYPVPSNAVAEEEEKTCFPQAQERHTHILGPLLYPLPFATTLLPRLERPSAERRAVWLQ